MYSREELINKLKEKEKELNQPPTEMDMEIDPFMPSKKTYRYRFGTFTNALKQAGITSRREKERQKLTKKNMLKSLKKLYGELGFVPRHKDIDKCEYTSSHGYYYKVFGSLNKAYDLIGLSYNRGKRKGSGNKMILNDFELKQYCKNENLVDPYIEEHIQPASIDLMLGHEFLIPDNQNAEAIKLDEEISYHHYNLKDFDKEDSFLIAPGQFVLATTMETVKIPYNMKAKIEGRSSIGRMGLFIQNAGHIDPGFEGQVTLELLNSNNRPIILVPGTRICQMVVAELNFVAEFPYDGKYQGQIGTTGSRIHLDYNNHPNKDSE